MLRLFVHIKSFVSKSDAEKALCKIIKIRRSFFKKDFTRVKINFMLNVSKQKRHTQASSQMIKKKNNSVMSSTNIKVIIITMYFWKK